MDCGKDRGKELRLTISCPNLQIGQNIRVEEWGFLVAKQNHDIALHLYNIAV